jgi:hypothetical protein
MQNFPLRLAAPCRWVSDSTDWLCIGLSKAHDLGILALTARRAHRCLSGSGPALTTASGNAETIDAIQPPATPSADRGRTACDCPCLPSGSKPTAALGVRKERDRPFPRRGARGERGTLRAQGPCRTNSNSAGCGITLELTGAQWHCAAGRRLASTLRGAMPLRVRVERRVMRRPRRRARPRDTGANDQARASAPAA